MALNLKLGERIELDPDIDAMSRRWMGFDPELPPQAIYEQNRGYWTLGVRATKERLATFSYGGVVKGVVALEGIEDIPSKDGRATYKAIVGRVLSPGHPDYDALIGTAVDSHRNPVTYIADPHVGDPVCACGCGTAVARARSFVPGHDQRAVHSRIARQWGSTLGFIDWFDATYPDPDPAGA